MSVKLHAIHPGSLAGFQRLRTFTALRQNYLESRINVLTGYVTRIAAVAIFFSRTRMGGW
jgi:hypothetical protein